MLLPQPGVEPWPFTNWVSIILLDHQDTVTFTPPRRKHILTALTYF